MVGRRWVTLLLYKFNCNLQPLPKNLTPSETNGKSEEMDKNKRSGPFPLLNLFFLYFSKRVSVCVCFCMMFFFCTSSATMSPYTIHFYIERFSAGVGLREDGCCGKNIRSTNYTFLLFTQAFSFEWFVVYLPHLKMRNIYIIFMIYDYMLWQSVSRRAWWHTSNPLNKALFLSILVRSLFHSGGAKIGQ